MAALVNQGVILMGCSGFSFQAEYILEEAYVY
jgi:hypothetical protein